MRGYLTCTIHLKFCAGHRIMGVKSKCANLHGHNFVVEVTARTENSYKHYGGETDGIGQVIDPCLIEQKIGGFIEANFDHGFILCSEDKKALDALVAIDSIYDNFEHKSQQQKIFVLPYNPTAENIAKYIGAVLCPQLLEDLPIPVVVCKVVVKETENCMAEWYLGA